MFEMNPYGMFNYQNPQANVNGFPNSAVSSPYQFPNQPQRQPEPPRTNMDWLRVNNMEDVDRITVQPNTKAWIMLANEPIFILKQADGMGLTTTDAYRFERIGAEKKPEYVTREEFEKFVESLGGREKEEAAE